MAILENYLFQVLNMPIVTHHHQLLEEEYHMMCMLFSIQS